MLTICTVDDDAGSSSCVTLPSVADHLSKLNFKVDKKLKQEMRCTALCQPCQKK